MIILGLTDDGKAYPIKLDTNRAISVTLEGQVTDIDVNLSSSDISLPIQNYPHTIYTLLNAEQVMKFGEAQNSAVSLYTVPAGKTLYLSSVFAHIYNASGSSNVADVAVYDGLGVKQIHWRLATTPSGIVTAAIPFATPVKVQQYWSVGLFSPASAVYIRGSFVGYLI
jgi:hypothetical protein